MVPHPGLIAVDWGTSTFRAYLVAADGTIIDRRETGEGILAAAGRGFARALAEAVAPWRAAHGGLPILMSGMIGSRQGWTEAPYVDCPAGSAALADRLCPVEARGLSPVLIVPGLVTRDADGVPDVMRGEETQILGAMAASGLASDCLVLPGTHSKWATVEAGRIVGFATYMTGEVYATLKAHSILGRMMTGDAADPAGFAQGVAAARDDAGPPGRLLHRIFSARTLALLDRLAPHQTAGYLSGLLIGAEIVAAAPPAGEVTIVANAGLAALYADAAAQLGIHVRLAPADCVAVGLLTLARAARLLEE